MVTPRLGVCDDCGKEDFVAEDAGLNRKVCEVCWMGWIEQGLDLDSTMFSRCGLCCSFYNDCDCAKTGRR